MVFNYVFALLMMLRIVQNNSRLTAAQREESEAKRAADVDKKEALAAALARGREQAEAEE